MKHEDKIVLIDALIREVSVLKRKVARIENSSKEGKPKLKCGACKHWARDENTDVGKCFLKSYPDYTYRWSECDENLP